MNANLKNIGGDVSLATTAVGNTFSEDTNARTAPVQNYQINNAGTFATSNTTVQNVGGGVSVSATAIGNNAQIVHYSTSP
jgi:lipid-binding SYLF domain-containing protein